MERDEFSGEPLGQLPSLRPSGFIEGMVFDAMVRNLMDKLNPLNWLRRG